LHVAFSVLTLDPGRVGGTETYVRGLLGAFAAGDGPERVSVLAGPRAAPTLAGLAGGPVAVEEVRIRLGRGRTGRLAALVGGMARAPRAARDAAERADVLHLPLTVPLPRKRGATVITLHDLLHHELPEGFGAAERAFRRLAYDAPARRATRVITDSEHAREQIIARLGVDPARVVAIPLGIDHARFVPGPVAEDAALLASLALPDGPWLLYPAARWPHKNHARLLAALARCPPDVRLVQCGAPAGSGGVAEAAQRSGIADRVVDLGYVPARVLPALYRAARALVFPSLAEGFGQPPLEAMACGCVAAVSDAPAVREACGDAALFFPAREVDAMAAAITRVVQDENLRSALRAAGLARAAEFTWRRSAARHAEVYEATVR